MWMLLLLLLVMPSSVSATEYFVSTSGSGSANCQTPGTACDTLQRAASMSSAGDTIYLLPGTYFENITAGTGIKSGTNDANRTVISGSYQGSARAVLGKGMNLYYVYENPPLAYVTFTDLVFDAGDGYQPLGNLHHIRLQNSEIKNVTSSGGAITGRAIYQGNYSMHHMEFINLHVHHNGFPRDVHPPGGHCFYSCSQFMILRDSDIHDCGSIGIQIYNAGDSGCADNTEIYNNRIHNNVTGDAACSINHGSNMKFYNNLVYNNGTAPNFPGTCGFASGSVNNLGVYNNTFHGNYGNPLSFGSVDWTTTNITVRNNIMVNNSTNGFQVIGPTSFGTVSNNLCPSSGGGTGCTHFGDPNFVNPGAAVPDFSMNAGSAGINQGADLISIFAFDFAKNGRPQGTGWDIGAYEFTEGGSPPDPPTGNPVYVAQTGGDDSRSCVTAETAGTPKLTIGSAICDCMHTVAGKRLIVKAGTYVETIDTATCPILGGNGPSFSNATTIETFGNDAVTIRLPATGTPVVFLHNSGTDHFILFKGSAANKLVIDGNNLANSNGVSCYAPGHHIRFEQVEVKNTAFETVHNAGCNNFELVDSYVHHAGTSGIAFEGNTSNNLIQRTAIYNNGGRGINFKSGTQTNMVIRESVMHDNATDGLFIGASTGAFVVNAIVQNNGGKGIHIASGAGGPVLQNSTVYANATVGVQCDAGASSAQITNVLSYGNTGGDIINNCGATVAKNLCAVTSADCAVGGDPLFVAAPTDLHLADGSPGIDAGELIPSILTDYDGNPRQQNTQDIGAYERTQIPTSGPDVTVRPQDLKQAAWYF